MAKILTVHSFRRGRGKSNIAANLAMLLAADGRRVGVIDTDLYEPGVHLLFGLDNSAPGPTLNDYLAGACTIEQAARDVSAGLGGRGRVFLVPADPDTSAVRHALRGGYAMERLADGLRDLEAALDLD